MRISGRRQKGLANTGGAFADQAIGNFMTEAFVPATLHQDPRYFTKGKGGFWRRTGYAISREVITRGDNGHSQFNTSELAGNAVAAGISNLYYPSQDRSFGNTANKWGQQIGLDTLFNVMKGFWPDTRRNLSRRCVSRSPIQLRQERVSRSHRREPQVTSTEPLTLSIFCNHRIAYTAYRRASPAKSSS
jgi:hypothetical protein